jgi:hypothetical protein
MATMTMPHVATAIKPKIKMAMENIGLGERADELLDVLDEMELDRGEESLNLDKELQLSLEEEDTISLDEWEQRVTEKAANGFYRRR